MQVNITSHLGLRGNIGVQFGEDEIIDGRESCLSYGRAINPG